MAQKNPNSRTMQTDGSILATRFNTEKFQLQRKNHFEIYFGVSVNNEAFIDKDLRFMVVNFPLPKETTESNDVNYFNQTIKTAGRTTFETSNLVLRDAIDYDTEKQFLTWRNKVYNPENGIMGIAADYKLNAKVIEYTPNGEKMRTWKLVGCWPSGVEYGDLTYDDGGEKQISVTITYDYAYRTDLDGTDRDDGTYIR